MRLFCSLFALALLPFLTACRSALQLEPSDHATVLNQLTLDAQHPGQPGSFPVKMLYYGSGEDLNRPEYRDSVTIVTESVDGSELVSWAGQASDRKEYWGFTTEEMPLNARVWYPDGDGPFPLVLIVHGNHSPTDFSDPGYGYLGELLASRGFIMASIDMNFINGVRAENDGRGWMLLKHVEAFEGFNEEEGNPFFDKVDMDRIALMGHSRGGEAVGHAAAFNRLSHYPDDASVIFDFNYNIRSIVAIAPVDGQYLPTERLVPVEDVNYMVFHGSHDGDVTSFHGLRLYRRLRFSEDFDGLKTAIYVYRANHGQWNSVWGPNDNGSRSGRILDLRALMPGEDQREFAKIYVSAFLEATLKKKEEYLPVFRDHRVIGEWLPETMYVTRFQHSSFRVLANFEEDIDVTSGTKYGVALRGDSLATWREGRLRLRSSNRPETSSSQDNQALWLRWNNRISGGEPDDMGPPAVYSITLPEGLARSWEVGPGMSFDLSLAAEDDTPRPRKRPDADQEGADSTSTSRPERERSDDRDEEEEVPIDLSIEVVDAAGASAKVELSRYGPIRKPLETRILRRQDLEEDRFQTLWEVVLQSYSVPLTDFTSQNAQLDLGQLREVRLVFDQAPAGSVIVDDIGLSTLSSGFTSSRIDGSQR